MKLKLILKEISLEYISAIFFNLLSIGILLMWDNKEVVKFIFLLLFVFAFLPIIFFRELFIKWTAQGRLLFRIVVRISCVLIPLIVSIFSILLKTKNVFLWFSILIFLIVIVQKNIEYYHLLDSVANQVFQKKAYEIMDIDKNQWFLFKFTELEKYSDSLKHFLRNDWLKFIVPFGPAIGIFVSKYVSLLLQILIVETLLLGLFYLFSIVVTNSTCYYVHLLKIQKKTGVVFQYEL